MTEDRNQNQEAGDNLARLVRASRQGVQGAWVRPDQADIVAYVLGEATARQDEAVRAAMLVSADFRREILELSEDMDDVDPEALTEVEIDPLQTAPDRSVFLAAREPKSVPVSSDRAHWLGRVLQAGPRAWVPVAVAAAVCALIFLRPGQAPTPDQPVELLQLALQSESVEAGLLIGNRTRVTSPTGEAPQATARDAALEAFRSMLVYQDGGFRLRDDFQVAPGDAAPGRLSLNLFDAEDKGIHEVHLTVPTGALDSTMKKVWLLVLPDRHLYTADLAGAGARINIESGLGSHGFIVVTFPVDGGFRGIVGDEVDLPDRDR